MDLSEFKIKIIREKFEIDEGFGRIYSFIDFGNVNYWFEDDIRNSKGEVLEPHKKLVISLEGLAEFSGLFSDKRRFYYGVDTKNSKSVGFISLARKYFDNVITKDMQRIKHHFEGNELLSNTRPLNYDLEGKYVYIPKCNFDVEICVDAIRLADNYETFCLFSSDADFGALVQFLKRKKKKFILIKGGFAQYNLKKYADLTINAQDIKEYVTFEKQKSSR